MAYEINDPNRHLSIDSFYPPTLEEIQTASKKFKLMTGFNSGDVVGSGEIRVFDWMRERIYTLSATVPVSNPPTIENDGHIMKYYALMSTDFSIWPENPDKNFPIALGPYGLFGTDDGLALFDISAIWHSLDVPIKDPDSPIGQYDSAHFLQISFYGGSGNGVINTMMQSGNIV